MTTKRAALHIPVVSASLARRMLLGAQGLLDNPERRAAPAALQRLIEQMGFVQVDSINVLERAHHLTLFSRMHCYQHSMLARLVEHKRSLFEHWTHDASVIPVNCFHHWKHRFDRSRTRIKASKWWRERMGPDAEKIISQVRDRIADEGPLLSRDFEHDRHGRSLPENGWWGWKPQKAALEFLWRTGELAVARRINFQKVYDLTERVLPAQHVLPPSPPDEHVDWACRSALERLGFATPGELAAFWHAIDLKQVRAWCAQSLQRGDIVEVLVESADGSAPRRAVALANWELVADRLPDVPQTLRLLCPFDPVLRDRQRAQRLFDFDYRFEAFVPAAKRRYGYYVLPILEGERLIGRLDPKFHRRRSEFEIGGIWWEPKIRPTRARRQALHQAVERLAAFIGADRITYAGQGVNRRE